VLYVSLRKKGGGSKKVERPTQNKKSATLEPVALERRGKKVAATTLRVIGKKTANKIVNKRGTVVAAGKSKTNLKK